VGGLEREVQTQQAFHSMEDSIASSEKLARRAAETTREQITHGEEIEKLVGTVVQIAGTQLDSAQIIAETAKDLSSRAEALRTLLSRFRTQKA